MKAQTAIEVLLLVVLASTPACAAPEREPMIPTSNVDATHDGLTLNPYHAVVRGKVLDAFRGLTAHDPEPALALMADDVRYTFEGEHALGGTRVTKTGVRKWFDRLLRLSPGAFVIRSVEVSGWPWSTRVVTTFEHYVAPPGEEPYWGPGVQIADLEWGAARKIRTYVDTGRLQHALGALHASGIEEAHAAPILE